MSTNSTTAGTVRCGFTMRRELVEPLVGHVDPADVGIIVANG